VNLALDHWSTQRFPQPQDPSTIPLGITMPLPVLPGGIANVHIETGGADPGIYYIDLVATGGGITKPLELALVVN
jgi:hypothetical protein